MGLYRSKINVDTLNSLVQPDYSGRMIVVSKSENKSAYSDDLGSTWTAVSTPTPMEAVVHVKDNIWLGVKSQEKAVCRSDDHGASWYSVPINVRNNSGGVDEYGAGWYAKDLQSKDGITIMSMRSTGTVLVSSDGGLNWEDIYPGGSQTYVDEAAVAMISATEWAVSTGFSKNIYYTDDGGSSFTTKATTVITSGLGCSPDGQYWCAFRRSGGPYLSVSSTGALGTWSTPSGGSSGAAAGNISYMPPPFSISDSQGVFVFSLPGQAAVNMSQGSNHSSFFTYATPTNSNRSNFFANNIWIPAANSNAIYYLNNLGTNPAASSWTTTSNLPSTSDWYDVAYSG